MQSPSQRQLDIFAQMVAAGSVARCASDTGIPADEIVRDISSLEMRLGYRLFDDVDGARLTPAGRRTAQAMTLLSQDAPETWESQPAPVPVADPAPTIEVPVPPRRRTITLAAPAPVFGHVQDALATFESVNDDIAIALDLHVLTATDAADALRDGRADIAYFYALEEPADPPSRYGWSEAINIYAGADHPLARESSVSRAQLGLAPVLTMERGNAMRAIVEQAMARVHAPTGPVVLESDNMFAILTALREGQGVFAAFGPLARDLGRMAGIKRIALDLPLPSIEVRQAISPRATETPGVEALADFLFL
ncbi:LysR family transcriptional regulator [Sphingobium sp.]|uniref:LysR family transcriptional regulator n=1 Tax=Sphingobium sp. TaxID=1912891 RepID=UPI003BB48A83